MLAGICRFEVETGATGGPRFQVEGAVMGAWKWDKAFEDAYWIVAQQVITSARQHFDASRNDAARSLVLLIERLGKADTVPYEVRRQLAHDVVNELEELAERAHRYAQQLLDTVPPAKVVAFTRKGRG